MKQIRLHPAHFIKYIKYALLLCVIPIIRAVLAFDILAAWLAFTQDLLILQMCIRDRPLLPQGEGKPRHRGAGRLPDPSV